MEKLAFKTNIKCGACVNNVTPFLNKVAGIKNWEVDLKDPERTLSVETSGATAQQVVAAIAQAGYKATPK